MNVALCERSREKVPTSPEEFPSPVVLVVDDEALIRWALREGLSESGYAVREASSAAEARAALASCGDEPLVVLLDLRLPDATDLSLLAEIRATRPDAPVVMMSAHAGPDDARAAERLGAYRFLGKPFDVTHVVRLVDEAWRHANPRH
jgi:DNA-binding NtrC family response regulator